MLRLWIFAAAFAIVGCSPDPIVEFRIGETVDVAALAARYGEADVVTLEPSKEVYYKHEFDREGVKFIVEFTKEKKILGVWAMIPCPEDEAAARIAALKDRVIALYRDKLESCGATKGAKFGCIGMFDTFHIRFDIIPRAKFQTCSILLNDFEV